MAPKQDVSLDITSDDDFDSELQFKSNFIICIEACQCYDELSLYVDYNLSPNSSNMNKTSGNAGFSKFGHIWEFFPTTICVLYLRVILL